MGLPWELIATIVTSAEVTSMVTASSGRKARTLTCVVMEVLPIRVVSA